MPLNICRSHAYAHPVLLRLPRDFPWPPRLQRRGVLLTEQVRTGKNPSQSHTSLASLVVSRLTLLCACRLDS
jgi:hypothetical protein